MLKYLIFLIIGIIIFILYNRKDSFSIGNQYKLTGQTKSLKQIFNEISDPSHNICDELGLDRCERIMNRVGGACQINTIGSFYSALNVSFTESDRAYLNSFGTTISSSNYLSDIYKCLTNSIGVNNKGMLGLLRDNNLDPQTYNENGIISSLYNNRLYPVLISFGYETNTGYTLIGHTEEATRSGKFSHNILLYKTDLSGFRAFVREPSLRNDTNWEKYDELNRKLALLENLRDDNPQKNGIVCICIDYCNKLFYALTELDYPDTRPEVSVDTSVGVSVDQTVEVGQQASNYSINIYNIHWKSKIVVGFMPILYSDILDKNNNMLSFALSPTSNTFEVGKIGGYDINSPEILANFMHLTSATDRGFPNLCQFHVYDFNTDYSITPDRFESKMMPRETCYGKIDRKCRSDSPDRPQCDGNLTCVSNQTLRDDISDRGSICLGPGELGAVCSDSDPPCNDSNMCFICNNMCERPYGEHNARCRETLLADGNKCNESLECNRNNKCVTQFEMLNQPLQQEPGWLSRIFSCAAPPNRTPVYAALDSSIGADGGVDGIYVHSSVTDDQTDISIGECCNPANDKCIRTADINSRCDGSKYDVDYKKFYVCD